MAADVLAFTGSTTADEPAESLLEKAKAWGMTRCLVVGDDENGKLRIGGSISDVAELLFLLKRAERNLLDAVDD